VSGNTSGQDGGGVYTLGTFTMSGSPVISLNKATGSGGGVYQNGGTFTLTGGTVYGLDVASKANTATASGAAYYHETSGGGISEFAPVWEYSISK
jgi:predicted outer membrane repeat protein